MIRIALGYFALLECMVFLWATAWLAFSSLSTPIIAKNQLWMLVIAVLVPAAVASSYASSIGFNTQGGMPDSDKKRWFLRWKEIAVEERFYALIMMIVLLQTFGGHYKFLLDPS